MPQDALSKLYFTTEGPEDWSRRGARHVPEASLTGKG